MGEVILINGPTAVNNKVYDWNWAFNNPSFIDYILQTSSSSSYYGSEIFIPDNEYMSSKFTWALFSQCWQYIGDRAFYNCNKMSLISFPNGSYNGSLYYIGQEAFVNDFKLKSVYLGILRNIKSSAFANDIQLESVYVGNIGPFGPDSDSSWMPYIDDNAFINCYKLGNLYGYSRVKRIGKGAFQGCIGLSYAYIGESVCYEIDDFAFAECQSLGYIAFNTRFYYSKVSEAKLKVGKKIFNNCESLTRVSIFGLSIIESDTFGRVPNLSAVDFGVSSYFSAMLKIADFIPEIGPYAFHSYNKLQTVYASIIKKIGSHAFDGCSMIRGGYYTAIGSYYCEEIDDFAFANCTNLSSLNFNYFNLYYPSYELKLGNSIFYKCSSFSSVNFYGCSYIGSLTLGAAVSTIIISNYGYLYPVPSDYQDMYYGSEYHFSVVIDDYAFAGNTALSGISVYNVKKIGSHAFDGCNNLYYTQLGISYCEEIDDYAFAACSKLSYLDLNNWASSVSDKTLIKRCILNGSNIFAGCKSLSALYITACGDIPEWLLANHSISLSIRLGTPDNNVYSYGYMYSISIGEYAFLHTTLYSIIISCVNTIGYGAFNGAKFTGYAPIIGNTICHGIGTAAFQAAQFSSQYNAGYLYFNQGYSNAQSASNITCHIHDRAFYNAIGLKGLYVYNVSSIENDRPFYNDIEGPNDTKILSIRGYISNGSNILNISDYTFSVTNFGRVTLENINRLGSYAFCDPYIIYEGGSPSNFIYEISINNIYSVDDFAIAYCQYLRSVTLQGISSINKNTIYQCPMLSWFSGTTITHIGEETFKESSYLSFVSIPSVMYIDSYAFYNCGLSSLYAPYIKNIGSYAFANCSKLSYIANIGTNNSDAIIGPYAFYNCSSLSTLIIGASSIGSHAFENCINLSILNGPWNFIKYIDDYGFANCQLLSMFTMAMNIEYIGEYAFASCVSISQFIFNSISSIPILKSINAFDGVYSSYKIYVPSSLYNDIINDSIWGLISDHISAATGG